VACPGLVGKGGVEEVSVVASLVGRNVAVESYSFGLNSTFLFKREVQRTSRKWTRPKSRRSETMVSWIAVRLAVRYSYTRLSLCEKERHSYRAYMSQLRHR
jgi:hypothetical protein